MKTHLKTIASILLAILVIGDAYGVLRMTWQAPVSIRIGELTPRSADISLRCDPSEIENGASTTISGRLVNATSNVGIPDGEIHLCYAPVSNHSLIFIAVVLTGPEGVFSYFWQIPTSLLPGFYAVNATFTGGNGFDSWTAITDLQVKAALSEKSSRETALIEDVLEQKSILLNGQATGDLNGTFNFTRMDFVGPVTGAFNGKGFSEGEWEARLEGTRYEGTWEGVFLHDQESKKIQLKGAMTGNISGTIEGYLTETEPESGTYDSYQATWRIGTSTTSAITNLTGHLNYISSHEFFGTELRFLQISTEGRVSGDYSCFLSAILNNMRIVGGSPYIGRGFSTISFTSELGSGEGWTCDKAAYPGLFELAGLFSHPLYGTVLAVLDENLAQRKVFMSIRRIDLGLPPAADLKVKIWGPARASPGQTIPYSIELRNDGFKSAKNITLVHLPPFAVNFLLASSSGNYDDVIHVVRWDFEDIPARTVRYLNVEVRILWGLPWGAQLTGEACVLDTKQADSLLKHASPGLVENVKLALQAFWIALTTATGVPTFGETELEAIEGLHIIRRRLDVTNALIENENYGMEVLALSNAIDERRSLRDEGWTTTDGKYYWSPDPSLSNVEYINRIIADLKVYYGFIPAADPEKSSTLTTAVAHDPNRKSGPEGYVSRDQTLNYTIEYENEGEGIAFGVYCTDTLDACLNDSTLKIGPIISSTNGSVIAGPGTYDPTTRTITWFAGETHPSQGGFMTLSVKVRQDIPEGSEIMNFAIVHFPSVPETTRTCTVISVIGQPNVAIIDVLPSRTVVGKGYHTYVNATVFNYGYFAETFNVSLYANTTLLASQAITLFAQVSADISINCNTSTLTLGNYSLTVTAEIVLGEMNTTDNNHTDGIIVNTIPGDVDGNFKVDIFDVVKITSCYGKINGDPLFNPNADIDGNGVINIFDVVICTGHYGQKWP